MAGNDFRLLVFCEMTVGENDSFELNGWRFHSHRDSISSAKELDEIQAELNAPQLPTMVFGRNKVRLEHVESGWFMEFGCVDALRHVDFTGEHSTGKLPLNDASSAQLPRQSSLLQVASAKEWQSSRSLPPCYRPFDWTFTPRGYDGKMQCDRMELQVDNPGIDYDRLRDRSKPIKWFAENILFEDELADNGLAQLNVRVRVMPDCWLVLMRFYLRVEGVLCRALETRVYHEFSPVNNSDVIKVLVESTHRETLDWKQFVSMANNNLMQLPVSDPTSIQQIAASLPLRSSRTLQYNII